MYKVFFNESVILLLPKIKNSLSGNIENSIEIQRVSDFSAFLVSLKSRKYVEEPIYKCLIEKDLVHKVIQQMNPIPAAGGIVRNIQGEILFIKRLGVWDLPKGKIEEGESTESAAVREVEEECGIGSMVIQRKLPSTYHIYQSPYLPEDDNWVWKETSWFEMSYSGSDIPVPQTEEDIAEVRWFAPSQLDQVFQSTYGNLRDLLNDYLA
ncbi:NUDIX hydrolase [Mangrovibacterium lignilyticum]|uniref:NUDIX hydrolase n=1 Tax=Mangrovibacterium lignilyticum TaxID=2668052 RepID=UPI0013D76612|nr:NUDIX domain-containing protein [Mangrovibacterium lignilyticum]